MNKQQLDPAIKKRRLYLAKHIDEQCIAYLEQHFQCDLPCFQRQPSDNSFDPLDAMRRDAYREVTLFLRRELNLAKKLNDND